MPNRDAVAWYDDHATHYSETMAEQPIVELVAWPGLRSLLPDLTGARALDAGCGDGTYTRRLVDRGADVVGVDASGELLALAEERHGDDIDFRRADLREPLAFLEDGAVDVVVSQLALDHVEDWDPVFEEFHRVLTPGGCAVVSASHPPTIWAKLDFDPDASERFGLGSPSYFEVEPWSEPWGPEDGEDGRVRKYRRPLSVQVDTAFDAGFVLDGLVEPAPAKEFEREQPERYERWSRRQPTFVCYRFRKFEGAGG